MSRSRWVNRLLFFVPFAISFVVYLKTVCPTVYTGDSGELSATAFTLSIAHPPGYPLLTLLGKAYLLFAWDSAAYALNILSALLASASAGFVALLVYSFFFKPEDRNDIWARAISIFGGLLLGFSGLLWAAAVGFEVYSLGILLMTFTLFLLTKYDGERSFSYLIAATYILGLSLANHLSAVCLLPAVIYYVVKSKPGFRRISSLALFFVLALTLYLYLPVRSAHDPLFDWNHPASPGSFIDHITARRYQTYVTGFGFDNWFQNIWRSVRILAGQYPLYLAAFGLIGLLVPGAIKKRFRIVLVSILVLNLTLSALYDIPDIDHYYLPSLLVLTLGFVSLLNSILSRMASRFGTEISAIILAAMAITAFLGNFRTNDQSENRLACLYGENILKSTPEDSFLISIGDNSNSSLYYLRYVEDLRPDLEIYDPVISEQRLRRRMRTLNLRDDLPGPDLCVLMGRAYPEKTFMVKEHMLARGNPFNYDRMNVFPRGMVYGFMEAEAETELWDDLTIPLYSELSPNLDFKGMTMLVNLHLSYGEDLFRARKRREAVEQYREARKIAESTREASVHNSLGIFFRHEGWPILARREYESALASDHLTADEKSNINVNLGNLEKDSGHLEKAMELYREALAINNDNADARYNLYITGAYDDINRRDYKSAAVNFEKALNLPESDPNISFNLGVIFDQNLHDTTRAVFYYKRFIESYPGSDRAEAALTRIEELQMKGNND